MRQQDKPEDVPALGKKIEKPAMPKPHIKVNGKEGVWKAPDGRYYTEKPENEVANPGTNPWKSYPYIYFWSKS